MALFPNAGRPPSQNNSKIREGPLALIRGLHCIRVGTYPWYNTSIFRVFLFLLLIIVMNFRIKLIQFLQARHGICTDCRPDDGLCTSCNIEERDRERISKRGKGSGRGRGRGNTSFKGRITILPLSPPSVQIRAHQEQLLQFHPEQNFHRAAKVVSPLSLSLDEARSRQNRKNLLKKTKEAEEQKIHREGGCNQGGGSQCNTASNNKEQNRENLNRDGYVVVTIPFVELGWEKDIFIKTAQNAADKDAAAKPRAARGVPLFEGFYSPHGNRKVASHATNTKPVQTFFSPLRREIPLTTARKGGKGGVENLEVQDQMQNLLEHLLGSDFAGEQLRVQKVSVLVTERGAACQFRHLDIPCDLGNKRAHLSIWVPSSEDCASTLHVWPGSHVLSEIQVKFPTFSLRVFPFICKLESCCFFQHKLLVDIFSGFAGTKIESFENSSNPKKSSGTTRNSSEKKNHPK